MMIGSFVRYMDRRESLKQGLLDNTASFRHRIYDILQNNVLCYIQNSKMERGTCKLYPFQLNKPQACTNADQLNTIIYIF